MAVWSDDLSHEEELLILDALALAIEACHWANPTRNTEDDDPTLGGAFFDLYQKLAPVIIRDDEAMHDQGDPMMNKIWNKIDGDTECETP
jgi:hypothetical protein